MNRLFAGLLAFAAFSGASSASADVFDDYTFDTASSAYASAVSIVQGDSQLLGEWTLVAACSRSYRGDFSKKDPNGLGNADRSVPQLFFSGDAGATTVRLLNQVQRNQNQGPVEVVFYETEGFASFAQYSYRAGRINDAVFFLSECRLFEGAQLLCAKRFYVNKPGEVNDEQRRLHMQVVGYDLYRR
ncbi:MAG: hypothetical protein A2X94_17650 [Bdellovibrionales bacterium GWB1_55_8]|nr:MAG: hypothetical protein A2X94_17650 [Bdellovibrionales bacterium GWB1_55_8]